MLSFQAKVHGLIHNPGWKVCRLCQRSPALAYNRSRYNLAQKYCDSALAQDITHTSQNISLLCNKNQAKTQRMKEIAGIATNTIPMGLLVY